MRTIMVIDDAHSELELISSYLREGGYRVIGISSAKDALSRVEQQRPDVVVTDIVMPGMSGFDLCRDLKGNPNTSSIPIVACTSKKQELDRLWGMKQGVAVYITKPCTERQLLQAVKSVLN